MSKYKMRYLPEIDISAETIAELKAKINAIQEYCADKRIPYYIQVGIGNRNGKPVYLTSGCDELNARGLTDGVIAKHFTAAEGGKVVAPERVLDLDF